MKIKFVSDDKLPLNKMIEIPIMTIVVRAVFCENNKYYPEVFLGECLYKIQKNIYILCYDKLEVSEEISDFNKRFLMLVIQNKRGWYLALIVFLKL